MVLSSLIDRLRDGSMLHYAAGQRGSLSFFSLLYCLFVLCLHLLLSLVLPLDVLSQGSSVLCLYSWL